MAETDKPRVHVEPPIPTTTEFCTVDQVRSVINQLDLGAFRMPSLLLERMMWNPRLRAVVNTRFAGLIATELRFKPSRNNKDARRAAKDFGEDWKLIAPASMRKQMLVRALFLGFSPGQRVPDLSPTTKRHIFKLRPYWPGFASWYWAEQAYRIQTFEAGVVSASTPTVDRKPIEKTVFSPLLNGVQPASSSPWVICEPFGVNSFRDAIMHAAWRPWLGHEWSMRDQARASEKHGIGVIKYKYPRGEGTQHKEAIAKAERGLRRMGSEGVQPLEQRGKDAQDGPGFDIEPFEFNGTGFQAISDTMNSNAVAFAILLLGHNLTTEIKGGGSYAAVGVADYIRDDVKYDDGSTEGDYARPQLAMPWAMANYGDPGLAPIFEYVTDSPAVNLSRAQMIQYLALAIAQLKANLPQADLEQLAEQFDIPILAVKGKAQIQVPQTSSAGPAETEEEQAA
jgi:hypothetical protein